MGNIKVTPGQRVVIGSQNRYQNGNCGTVTKVARVWIDVQMDGSGSYPLTLRFRLDTQTDGSEIGIPDRFYTLDQWAERERENEALNFLRGQGIEVYWSSPWRDRKAELADMIRAAVTAATPEAAEVTPAPDGA